MSIRRAGVAVLGGLFLVVLTANSSRSQVISPWPATPNSPVNVANLDALLANKQYMQLGLLLKQVSLSEMLLSVKWQNDNIIAGKSAMLGFSYTYDLWRAVVSMPDEKSRPFKSMAVQTLLYTYQIVVLDGVKCEDASAPANRVNQVFSTFPDVWKHVSALTDDERAKIVDTVLGLEKSTAPKRGNDDFLCLGGVAQLNSSISTGAAAKDGKSVPGIPGRTIDVMVDPNYRPNFVNRDVWEPKQAALRATMQATLKQVLDRYKAFADKTRATP
ncbi:MAG: hypothetical protein JWN71_3935 [Xanthobacteraceae bacterium]|nr:hypothetical protein [Xanthobacteraceae bacterium]